MTTLPTGRAPASTPTSPPITGPARTRTLSDGLGAVIALGLRALTDLRRPSYEVRSGDLAGALHTAIDRYDHRAALTPSDNHLDRVVISLRVAGAHLDAGNLVEARLALDNAHHALPDRHRHATEPFRSGAEDASAVAGARAQPIRCRTPRLGSRHLAEPITHPAATPGKIGSDVLVQGTGHRD